MPHGEDYTRIAALSIWTAAARMRENYASFTSSLSVMLQQNIITSQKKENGSGACPTHASLAELSLMCTYVGRYLHLSVAKFPRIAPKNKKWAEFRCHVLYTK